MISVNIVGFSLYSSILASNTPHLSEMMKTRYSAMTYDNSIPKKGLDHTIVVTSTKMAHYKDHLISFSLDVIVKRLWQMDIYKIYNACKAIGQIRVSSL